MENSSKRKLVADWFESYSDDLYLFIRNKINNHSVAQDIMQDTFVAALKNVHTFKEQSSPKSWLMAIAKRKIIDYFRSYATVFISEESAEEADPEELHMLDNPVFVSKYNRALASLPRQWRKILTARYIDGKKAEEICNEYAISKENYWQIMHRAKLFVKQKISSLDIF